MSCEQLGLGFHEEPSFHDRDGVTPEPERVRRNAAASKQESAILAWLERRTAWAKRTGNDERVTPWDVAEAFPRFPVTSCRRALTNLTRAGKLEHYPRDRRVSGPYKVPSGTWGLA